MVKKKKSQQRTQPLKKAVTPASFFMGLTKPQTQSLAVGIIIVGLGLFALASFTTKNKEANQMAMVSPADSGSMSESMSPTPTLTKMISATSTARMVPKQPIVTKLPNTSSKVTYTVEENDSVAKIGEKLCQSDRAWLSIVATNNLMYPYTIHSGETYIITCN